MVGALDEVRVSDGILTPDQFLYPPAYPGASISIVQQPANADVVEYRAAAFSATAVVSNAPVGVLAYQWQQQADSASPWIDVTNATSATLALPRVLVANSGWRYRVKVYIPASVTLFSDPALLTVLPDTNAPAIASAGSLDGTNVGVRFNERLDPTTATATTNYSLGGGVTIEEAILLADGRSVVLRTTGLPSRTFSLGIGSVKDLAGNPVNAGTDGTTLGLVGEDIGVTPQPGASVSFGPATIDVQAAGAQFGADGGYADAFHFTYRQQTNDFDVNVRVGRFQANAGWATAQLMVRESLAADSRNMNLTVYPAQKIWAAYGRLSQGGSYDLLPGNSQVYWNPGVDYPNVWLRIKRSGNTFTLYGGSNGLDWVPIADAFTPDPAYPAVVYLGLGTSSAEDGMSAAQYLDWGDTAATLPELRIESAYHTLDGTSVVIVFGEAVDTAAGNPANYSISSPGATVSQAVVQADNRTVVLTVSGLTYTGFGLRVTNVHDLFGNPTSGARVRVDSGLHGHYKFDGNALDSSAQANHASEVNRPSYGAGKVGQALVLNGIGQRADASDPGLAGNGPKSMSAWFKKATTQNKGMVSFGRHYDVRVPGGSLFEMASIYSGFVGHFSGSGGDTIPGAPYPLDEWQHGVITYDGTYVRTYLQGSVVTTKEIPLLTAPGPLHLGSGATEGWTSLANFDGMVDDIGLWDRELSATEVEMLYNGGLAGRDLNLDLPPLPIVLTLTRSAGGITLSWPQDAGPVFLQANGALTNSPWVDVTTAPILEGDMEKVTVQATNTARFYRLRR